MFWHIFSYRLKSTVRDVQTLFWTLAFPVILVSFFAMAFSNLENLTDFETVKIGLVNTQEYQDDAMLQAQFKAISEEEEPLFDVTMI